MTCEICSSTQVYQGEGYWMNSGREPEIIPLPAPTISKGWPSILACKNAVPLRADLREVSVFNICIFRLITNTCELFWSGRRESNPRHQLGRLRSYHYTTPAQRHMSYFMDHPTSSVRKEACKRNPAFRLHCGPQAPVPYCAALQPGDGEPWN
jgi:hypothetical protein